MNFHSAPASDYALTELVNFLNQGFEDYVVPIQFNTLTFLQMLRKDGLDLTLSRVLLKEDQPCGIALISRRGWVSRLAAMGISRSARGQGAGSWLMDQLIREACQRSDREMVLEVIEQNEPAVKLYQKYGFQPVRRLIGFIREHAEEHQEQDLQDIDLRELSRAVSQHGLADLPWQLSAESIAQLNPPARAYQNGPAFLAVSNPDLEHVVIWSLLVEAGARGRGLGTQMLRSVMARHAGKIWHVPAILPEELGRVFEKTGFEREELSQWQMKRSL